MTELEKAAREELIHSYAIITEGELSYERNAMLNMFRKGAQWLSKQSPWIKTSEKLPTPTIEIVNDEEYGSVFVVGRTSKWKTPQLCCYYGYNGNYRWENGIVPEYWMPIPE